MLIVSASAEFDGPVATLALVSWVAVNVLLLRHVDAGNSLSVVLSVPWVAKSPRVLHRGVELLSLVGTDATCVLGHVQKSISVGLDGLSLDGSVLQFEAVWCLSGWLGVDVALEFLCDGHLG